MRSLQAKGKRYSEWPSRPTPARDKESCIAGRLSIQRQLRKRNPKSEIIAGRSTVYSQLLSSRITCNCLKTKDRCHAYPSHKRRPNLPQVAITMAIASTNSRLKTGRNPLTLLSLVILRSQSLDQSSGSDECGTHKQLSAF